jgi:Ca-activated chloride channel family protein
VRTLLVAVAMMVGASFASDASASSLAVEVFRRVVNERRPAMRRCYEAGLARDPKLRGRVVVRFVIDASGKVTRAVDGGSELPDAAVVACVVRVFATMKFPSGPAPISVTYPLVFEPR